MLESSPNEDAHANLARDGRSDVESRSTLIAQKVGGDAASSLSRVGNSID